MKSERSQEVSVMSRQAEANRKARRYRGARYWEQETPREADCGRVRFRYYPDARRFQVVQLWRDENGDTKPGKTVTIDLEWLALSEQAKTLLAEVLHDAR